MLPGAAPFFLADKTDIALITLSRRVIVIIKLSALIPALLAVLIISSVYEEYLGSILYLILIYYN